MIDQSWTWFSTGSWVVILATVGFFLIKGLLWLAIPFILIRARRSRRNAPNCDDLQELDSQD